MDFKLEKMKIDKFRNIDGEVVDFTLNFNREINIISGHNGVGKSNILSLISSGTGMSISNSPTRNNFQPEFYDYFKISSDEDISNYNIFSRYTDSNNKKITKRLRFKDDTNSGRDIRIIPTNSRVFSDFQSDTQASNYYKER